MKIDHNELLTSTEIDADRTNTEQNGESTYQTCLLHKNLLTRAPHFINPAPTLNPATILHESTFSKVVIGLEDGSNLLQTRHLTICTN